MAYTKQTWTNGVSKLNATRMQHIEDGLEAAAIVADAAEVAGVAIPKSIIDVKGDLIVGTAADTAARLAVGADDKMLKAASAQSAGLKWDYPPGYELAYVEKTSNVSVTSTTEASPDDVVSAGAVSFDGVTPVVIELWAEAARPPLVLGASLIVTLWDGATDLGRITGLTTPAAQDMSVPLYGKRKLTPTSGSHTYKLRAWVTPSGTGQINAGAGGSGNNLPAFVRITRA